MISWIGLALTLLKVVNNIIIWARERELITEGQDQEIAEEARLIMIKTDAGKAILEKVNAMSESEVDAGLRDLEPK